MQPNAKQIVVIVIALLSFLASASANLTELFGPGTAKIIVSTSTFLNGLISAALMPFLSNTSVVKDAGALKGVDIQVSRTAAPAIAALAIAPAENGIAPAPGEGAAVKQVAEGTAS